MKHRYWPVTPTFWNDSQAWSEDARVLGIYLLTCPHRTSEGLFRLPPGYVIEDLGWDAERVDTGFKELSENGFATVDRTHKLVLITNALKYTPTVNPNQVTGALKRLAEIPAASPLTCTFRTLCQRFDERLLKQLPDGFGTSFSSSSSSSAPDPTVSEDIDPPVENPQSGGGS